jgi:hypothetical protein
MAITVQVMLILGRVEETSSSIENQDSIASLEKKPKNPASDKSFTSLGQHGEWAEFSDRARDSDEASDSASASTR